MCTARLSSPAPKMAMYSRCPDHGRLGALVSAGVNELRHGAAESDGQLLEAALQLWRGEPWQDLGDCVEISAARQRLTGLRDVAAEELQSARLACGDPMRAAAELREAVMQAPYRERRWELLALALYRSGRQGQALAELRRVRELLIEDLGVEPGAALRALEQRMLDQDPALLLLDTNSQRPTSARPPIGTTPCWNAKTCSAGCANSATRR